MGRYTARLERLKIYARNRVQELGGKIVVGDETLLNIQREADRIEESMEGKEECDNCDGWGQVECDECGHDRECVYCEDGLVEK